MRNPHLVFEKSTLSSNRQFWRDGEPINLLPKKVPEYFIDATVGQVICKADNANMNGRIASLDSLERQGVVQIGDLLQCSERKLRSEFAIAVSSIKIISRIVSEFDEQWCNSTGALFLGMNLGKNQTSRYRKTAALRGWQY